MTNSEGAAPSRRELGHFSAPVFALLALLVWVDQTTVAAQIGADGAGGSFQSAMDHLFHARARAGVDWVFTYGPLGYLQNLTYDPPCFLTRLLLVDVLWKGLWAVVFVRALARNPGSVARSAPVFLLVLLPIWGDAYVYLVLLAGLELVLDAPASTRRAVAFALVALPLSLGKFTFCAVALPFVALAAWARWRALGRAPALRFLGACAGAWLLAWVALGQSLLDLPTFFARSLRMAGAYGGAMNTEAQPGTDTLAFAVLGLAVVAWALAAWPRRREPGATARALARAFVLLVAFKAGMVRGFDHPPIFFGFAALAVFLFDAGPVLRRTRRVAEVALRAAVLVLGWIGLTELVPAGQPVVATFASQAGIQFDGLYGLFTHLESQQAMYDAMRVEFREQHTLQGCRRIVGDEPIDVLAPCHDAVLQTGLNWRPRPVFVSYAALDRELQRMNARFLESAAAPDWLLFRPEAIDGRLATSEDAPTLVALARDWRPVYLEQDLLLFRRERREGAAPRREVVLERDLAFGEQLDVAGLPGRVKLLEFEALPTLRGSARALLLRPAELHGRFTTVEGRAFTARLVPSMFQDGVIVDPVLNDTLGWLRWYEGRPERLRSLVFLPPAPAWAFGPAVRVRVTSEELEPLGGGPELEKRFLFPGLDSTPDALEESKQGYVARREGAFVRVFLAPSTLRFRLQPGHRRVSGAFGLLEDAWTTGASDGVTLHAQLEAPDGATSTVFQRWIDPRERAEDRGELPFDFDFDVERDGTLLLRIRPGPDHDKRDDRAFLSRLRVE